MIATLFPGISKETSVSLCQKIGMKMFIEAPFNSCKSGITQRFISSTKDWINSGALVAHACNPSYSGGRDQENHSSKPVPGK
jgi:hypothetical protein